LVFVEIAKNIGGPGRWSALTLFFRFPESVAFCIFEMIPRRRGIIK